MKFLIITGIIIGSLLLIALLFILLALLLKRLDHKKNEEHVLAFFKNNKEKASLFLIHNDKVVINSNSSCVIPLASTVKIMIAIAYAEAVQVRRIDEDIQIPLSELEKFYIPGTDGDSHKQWLDHLEQEELITNQSVSLREVAVGMIRYSSNANTEYLISLLGLGEIQNLLERMELHHHECIFPIGSSFLLPAYLSRIEGLSTIEIKQRIQVMSQQEYIELSIVLHDSTESTFTG